jgi:hypothetical protein
MPGKRVEFDEATWQAIALLADERKVRFQDLALEAFRDLLRKHAAPVGLRSALRQSVGGGSNVHKFPAAKKTRATRRTPRTRRPR